MRLFGVYVVRTTHPFVLAGVVALATTGAAGRTACAGTGPTDGRAHPKLTANIAVVSDYVVRGVSYSDHAPAIQGGVVSG